MEIFEYEGRLKKPLKTILSSYLGFMVYDKSVHLWSESITKKYQYDSFQFHIRISPRIFEKNRNRLREPLTGPGEAI